MKIKREEKTVAGTNRMRKKDEKVMYMPMCREKGSENRHA
jgi:hypothetical protein